jgi:sporulation protein YabP
MAFEIEKKSAEHSLFLFDRKEIKITGVSKIISFDDSYVMLSSVLGDIDVSGNNMKVDALDLESGYALISGEICGINYIDDSNKKKKRFWN